MKNYFRSAKDVAEGQLAHQKAHRSNPTYVKAKGLVDAFIERQAIKRAEPIVMSRGQYDAFVLHVANFVGHAGAHKDPARLFRMDGVSSEDLARRIALQDDEATVTKGAFAVFFNQVMATYFDQFESIQTEALVTMGTMDAPSAYFVFEQATYTSTTGFYDQDTSIVDNLDPAYGRGIAECAVAPSVGLENRSETISVETFRLSASYSFEAEQDYAAVHSRSVPNRLAEIKSTVYNRNIQAIHVNALIDDAAHEAEWDATPAGVYATLDPKRHMETLWSDAVLAVSLDMELSIDVRRPADLVVGGPGALQYFDKALEYRKRPTGILFQPGSVGVSTDIEAPFVGSTEVRKFEMFPHNQLLVMARGDGSRPVRVHATYGPSLVTFVPHTDPTRGCTSMGIAARVGMKTLLPNAIGVVDIIPAT